MGWPATVTATAEALPCPLLLGPLQTRTKPLPLPLPAARGELVVDTPRGDDGAGGRGRNGGERAGEVLAPAVGDARPFVGDAVGLCDATMKSRSTCVGEAADEAAPLPLLPPVAAVGSADAAAAPLPAMELT